MKKNVFLLIIFSIIILLLACSTDSAKDSDEIKILKDGSETTLTKNLDKSIALPEDYPMELLPIYDNLILITAIKGEDGSFTISGGSNDSIESIIEFYEDILNEAQVLIKDYSADGYSNIGELKGRTYTVNISEAEGDLSDRFKSFVMIILVPSDPSID